MTDSVEINALREILRKQPSVLNWIKIKTILLNCHSSELEFLTSHCEDHLSHWPSEVFYTNIDELLSDTSSRWLNISKSINLSGCMIYDSDILKLIDSKSIDSHHFNDFLLLENMITHETITRLTEHLSSNFLVIDISSNELGAPASQTQHNKTRLVQDNCTGNRTELDYEKISTFHNETEWSNEGFSTFTLHKPTGKFRTDNLPPCEWQKRFTFETEIINEIKRECSFGDENNIELGTSGYIRHRPSSETIYISRNPEGGFSLSHAMKRYLMEVLLVRVWKKWRRQQNSSEHTRS